MAVRGLQSYHDRIGVMKMKLYQFLWFLSENAHIQISHESDGFMWVGRKWEMDIPDIYMDRKVLSVRIEESFNLLSIKVG